jgi:hypothetical protein
MRDNENKCDPREAVCDMQACRESALNYIRQKAKRKRDESYRLEKLADELERLNLSPEADTALYDLAMKAGH